MCRKTWTSIRTSLAVLFLSLPLIPLLSADADSREIRVLSIDGVINPLSVRYLKREIELAEKDHVQALILELDTPGGLESSMRDMVQSLLNASLPIIVYVTPQGARAASAGMFITIAAHAAAMAPGTNIGAAHPVNLGTSDEKKSNEELNKKVVSDAAALARAIAQERGRNIAWAELAVRESVSLTADEAVREGVVDWVATDRNDLLQKLNGKNITLKSRSVELNTLETRIIEKPMQWTEKILHTVTDPNIAYLLLTLGSIGVIAELFSPGLIFPGLIGAICLITGFAALGSLPISWAGVVLIAAGIALLVLEAQAPGIGIFGVAGLIAFAMGSFMLYTPISIPSPVLPKVRVNPWLIAGISSVLFAFSLIILRAAFSTRRHPVTIGSATLLGSQGIALTDLAPKGMIDLRNEHWSAILSPGSEVIHSGDRVEVVQVGGAILEVRKKGNI